MMLAVAQAAVAPAPPTPSRTTCAYDRRAMGSLDFFSFDQDPARGWRRLSDGGCELAAADAIRDWRQDHRSRESLLFWHEGQLRANAGQTSRALVLFEESRKTPEEDGGFGWNLYVDGTVAFLRRDRAALAKARGELAVLPRPAGFAPKGPDGKPREVRWPMNLNVLDGLVRCWALSYRQAYACASG